MTYLKRFYLKNTVMDWHPRNVMYVYRVLRKAKLLTSCQVDRVIFGDKDDE